jgi:catechol 2,3-dioxygenase-like lactoylglutathione lyase family enzyme
MSHDRAPGKAGFAALPPHPFFATTLSASLSVGDLGESLAWYRDVLGFVVEREFERSGVPFAVRLSAGSVALLLTQDDGARGSERRKGEGFSLQLTTTQSVDAMATWVESCGVALDSQPADAWGARVFRVRDPDGFRLVISSERQSGEPARQR